MHTHYWPTCVRRTSDGTISRFQTVWSPASQHHLLGFQSKAFAKRTSINVHSDVTSQLPSPNLRCQKSHLTRRQLRSSALGSRVWYPLVQRPLQDSLLVAVNLQWPSEGQVAHPSSSITGFNRINL
jgi:hypothetical protein